MLLLPIDSEGKSLSQPDDAAPELIGLLLANISVLGCAKEFIVAMISLAGAVLKLGVGNCCEATAGGCYPEVPSRLLRKSKTSLFETF